MSTSFEILTPEFGALLPASVAVEKLASGTLWAEGPAYLPERDLLVWSDVRSDRMWCWSEAGGARVFREPSGHSNGNTVDLEGRLLTCEHENRRISRTEPDGAIVTVVDRYRDRRLNSPNDLVVKSDGTIWFTDPPYGIIGIGEGTPAEAELGGNYVFRFDPASGRIDIAASDFAKPNGIAFSPDESLLYVADTARSHDPAGAHHIRVFDVEDGLHLSRGRVFAEVSPGFADGFCVDEQGKVFTSAWDGIQVYSPKGGLLGKIRLSEKTANCNFGGPLRDRLFITASTSLYAVHLNTRGAGRP